MQDHPDAIAIILKEDLVIPAGTKFEVGPTQTVYEGNNFRAVIPFSKDESFNVDVFVEKDMLEYFTFLYP